MSKDTRRFVRRSPHYYSDFHFIDSYVSANLHCTLASDHVCCICVIERRQQCPPVENRKDLWRFSFISLYLSLSLSSPFISISFALVFFYVLRSFESHADSTKSRCFCVRRLSRVPWGLPMNVNSGKCRLNTEAFVDTGRTYRASWKFMSTTRIAI